jgi:hypothetical protein
MIPTHYIFVDFENVHSVDLDLVEGNPVKVILLIGKSQSRVDYDLMERVHRHSSQVRLVKAGTSGRNALDFVLAWEVGAQSAADPDGHYHVVSRDKGFDAMITHLQSRGLQAARHASFAEVPPLRGPSLPVAAKVVAAKPAATKAAAKHVSPPREPKAAPARTPNPSEVTPKALAEAVRQWLVKYPEKRPKRKTALVKLILSNIAKDLTPENLTSVLNRLGERKIIAISDAGAVTYPS